MLISDRYLELQKQLHAAGGYGASSAKWAKAVSAFADQLGTRSVLDYGCGQGLLKGALTTYSSLEISEYDPAIEGKHNPPEPADLVFCGDVLEHIEPNYLEKVLDDIARLAQKAVLLVIATRPAQKELADGRNAHLIIEPAWWWMRRFAERWKTSSFAGSRHEFNYVGITK